MGLQLGEPGYLRIIVTRRVVLLPLAAAALAVVGLALSASIDGLPLPLGPGATAPAAAATSAPPTPTAAATPSASADPQPTPGPIAIRPTGPTAHPRIIVRLQERLDRLRVELGVPGVQATILFPDGTSWTGVSGLADISFSTAVTPDTPFAIASISKSFTAAVVLQLIGEGRVGLDDAVAGHLPNLKLDSRITVRQLLDHTSGLNDFLVSRAVDRQLRAEPSVAWTTSRSMAAVGKPYFLPGAGWHYSNTNYVVLGLLAESLTGETLSTLVRARVFVPLGLDSATYQGAEEAPRSVARAYRFAVGPPGGAAIEWIDGSEVVPFTAVVTASAGAGSIAASSTDVARFARAMWGGGLVPESLRLEAIADAALVVRFRRALPYGLGTQVYPVDGRRAVGHSGRFSGARSIVRYLPDEDLAIAVLTNQSRIDPAIILGDLLAIASPPSRSGHGAIRD